MKKKNAAERFEGLETALNAVNPLALKVWIQFVMLSNLWHYSGMDTVWNAVKPLLLKVWRELQCCQTSGTKGMDSMECCLKEWIQFGMLSNRWC
jgi:hypothetical protein